MKKFLLVVALVLCMAFPAAAKTVTVANSTDLKAAVASADVDTIVISADISLGVDDYGRGLKISSDRTLTLQINEGCKLSVTHNYALIGIVNYGNLTIKGGGSLEVKCTNTDIMGGNAAIGVNVDVPGGTLNIVGDVSVSVDNTDISGSATGVSVSGTLNIADNASVSVSASGSNTTTVVGVSVSTVGTANILSAGNISATYTGSGSCTPHSVSGSSDDLTVYTGTFSDNDAVAYLGPDSAGVTSGSKYVVTNNASMTFDKTSLDVAQGSSGVVSVNLCASGDTSPLSVNTVEAFPAVSGITVTSSDGAIQFNVAETCKVGTYTFNVICSAENSGNANSKPHMQVGKITVTVTQLGSALTVNPTSADVLRGSSAAFTADMKINNESVDIKEIAAEELPDGMTCTLNGKTVTITTTEACAVGEHKLTLTATDNNGHTAEAKITVNVTEKSDPEPTPTPTGSASNGGCNAGFAGLALAAFALLAAKRKK